MFECAVKKGGCLESRSIYCFTSFLFMHEFANMRMRIANDLKNVYWGKKVVTISLIVNDSQQSLL